jgi:hypothetical protein
MAVIYNKLIGRRRWGWYAGKPHNLRMHLQPFHIKDRYDSKRNIKVWLEDRGKRIFEIAEGKPSKSDIQRLYTRIQKDRERIEDWWAGSSYLQGMIEMCLQKKPAPVLLLTVYPKTENEFVRKVPLEGFVPSRYLSKVRKSDIKIACPPGGRSFVEITVRHETSWTTFNRYLAPLIWKD